MARFSFEAIRVSKPRGRATGRRLTWPTSERSSMSKGVARESVERMRLQRRRVHTNTMKVALIPNPITVVTRFSPDPHICSAARPITAGTSPCLCSKCSPHGCHSRRQEKWDGLGRAMRDRTVKGTHLALKE